MDVVAKLLPRQIGWWCGTSMSFPSVIRVRTGVALVELPTPMLLKIDSWDGRRRSWSGLHKPTLGASGCQIDLDVVDRCQLIPEMCTMAHVGQISTDIRSDTLSLYAFIVIERTV
jgi:hypothetical protein